MDALTGPGLAPLGAPPRLEPDRSAEPGGFLVAADDGTRIHFLDWDASGAPRHGPAAARVLLVPGLASTAWSWAPVARRLRAAARVVAMDLRGHGLSDAPTTGYEPGTLARDALAVAEGAGLLPAEDAGPAGRADVPAPFVVAGIGLGAIVAAWTARALAERCAGLVFVDGGWEDLAAATDATPEDWLAAIGEPPEVLVSMTAWLADRAAFDPPTWDADGERAARAQVVETAAGRVKLAIHPHALAGSVRAMWDHDPRAVLAGVTGRVAALVARDPDGTRLAALAALATERAAAGRSPILAASFPSRGHDLARHEPDAVAAAVLATAARATMPG